MKTELEFINERNEMLKHVGEWCKVVRPGELEWENGTIIGVMSDKRSNVNMYRVELKDKKVINKTPENKLFKLLNVVNSNREVKSRVSSVDGMSKEAIIKEIAILESKIEMLKSKLSAL
jgi:hypothetical protein